MTRPSHRGSQRRSGSTRSTVRAAAFALIVAACPAALAADNPSEGYQFEVQLAPVCLDGTFDVTVGAEQGSLTVTTDVSGKLSGTLDLGGQTFKVKGKAKYRTTGHSVKLTARAGKKNSISFRGNLVGVSSFDGEAKGKGAVAAGTNAFSIDVGTAQPQVAEIDAVVEFGKKGKLSGEGTVRVCGRAIVLKASGKDGKTFKLSFKGGKRGAFKFTGAGDHVEGSSLLTWTAKGYGAKTGEDVINVDTVLSPRNLAYADGTPLYETEDAIVANAPAAGGDPIDRFDVLPNLPTGLDIDTFTGVISGTPVSVQPPRDYTVTATNFAGTDSATVTIEVRQNRAFSLAAQPNLSTADIRHFLNRTQFGVDDADIAAIQDDGLDAFIDEMMDFQLDTSWEIDARNAEFVDVNNDPLGIVPSTTDIARWWAQMMMTSENPFQEVLAFFWHDHFAVGSQDLGGNTRPAYMIDYINLWRSKGTGNYRDLLVDMSRNEAMLRYLDSYNNRDSAPNENFAREFWELFTLGVDNGYDQEDIELSSIAFTGWRERNRQLVDYPQVGQNTTQFFMEFDVNRHDGGEKTVLDITVPAQDAADDFEAVIDITLSQRDPDHFICRKIVEHFAFDNPPEQLVDALAAVLRDGGWELKPVFKTLFLSEAFYAQRGRENFVKNPVEFGVGFIRTTGLRIRSRDLDSRLNILGQRPSQPPVVDGWPTGPLWLSAQAMVDRTNLAFTVIEDENRQEDAGINVLDIIPPPGERSATEIVDALAALMQVEITDAERDEMIAYMVSLRNSDGSTTVSLLTDLNMDERVRGLLYILAQHPTYQIR